MPSLPSTSDSHRGIPVAIPLLFFHPNSTQEAPTSPDHRQLIPDSHLSHLPSSLLLSSTPDSRRSSILASPSLSPTPDSRRFEPDNTWNLFLMKASETIRKEYDHKCRLLRHQYARGLSVEAIDKTRAAVKDLHSQLRVSIQAVDSISKKIEKLRDAELQPQLLELIHGLARMWKVMLECHHAQFITISLAYHVKSSRIALEDESYRQTLVLLHDEVNCYHSSFISWINAHKSYLEALNMWLQKCIQLPQDQPKYRKAAAFAPRQAVFPPIFVLCQNWLTGIKSLESKDLCDAIGGVVSLIESKEKEKLYGDLENKNKLERVGREEKKCREDSGYSSLQTSLKSWFDQLKKVSEVAVKVFEDVKKSNDAASMEYTNCGSSI